MNNFKSGDLMDEINRVTIYSMIGITAIFFSVLLAVPSGITGNSLRDLFRGNAVIVGECTSARDTCPQSSFCAAKLMQSPNSGLKGIYRGSCIKKYPSGYLCRKDYQCESSECIGISDVIVKSKLLAPQIGGCA